MNEQTFIEDCFAEVAHQAYRCQFGTFTNVFYAWTVKNLACVWYIQVHVVWFMPKIWVAY